MSNTTPNTTPITNQDFARIIEAIAGGRDITINGNEQIEASKGAITMNDVKAYRGRIEQPDSRTNALVAAADFSNFLAKLPPSAPLDRDKLRATTTGGFFDSIHACFREGNDAKFDSALDAQQRGRITVKCVAKPGWSV